MHLVSAWSSESQLVLSQVKVLDKSNEITAIPLMPWVLKKIAAKIKRQKSDCILSLKANHPTLFKEVSDWFESLQSENTLPPPLEHITEAGHYRIEIRKCWAFSLDQLPALYQSDEWAGLQSIVVVERTRHLRKETTHEIQFYLSSLPSDSPHAAKAIAIRQHWGIENLLHWVLDVTFKEDACRVRSLHSPHNLTLIRRFALNTLNSEHTFKGSLKQKSKRAAMDNNYMLTLLTTVFAKLEAIP